MARPAKPTAVSTGKTGKVAQQRRLEQESKLRGNADDISPPGYLNLNQVRLFNAIVEGLKASEILGNLDIHILSTAVIAMDRLQHIETKINEDPDNMLDKMLMSAMDKYTKVFFRSCNELGLSPQSRSKLGNINLEAEQKEADPVLALFKSRGKK